MQRAVDASMCISAQTVNEESFEKLRSTVDKDEYAPSNARQTRLSGRSLRRLDTEMRKKVVSRPLVHLITCPCRGRAFRAGSAHSSLEVKGEELCTITQISINSTAACVGAAWNLGVSNAGPDTPVILTGTSNGQSWSIANWATTDANGSLSQDGAFAGGTQGSYTLMVQTSEKMSNTISFVVSNCPSSG